MEVVKSFLSTVVTGGGESTLESSEIAVKTEPMSPGTPNSDNDRVANERHSMDENRKSTLSYQVELEYG